jgi:hypothetical protein
MSQLYDAVSAAVSRGARTTDEILAECHRSDLTCRPETIELFLKLSRVLSGQTGPWSSAKGSKEERILAALAAAFSGRQTYLPVNRLANHLEGEAVTAEEIASACHSSGLYRMQGSMILRSV